MFNIETTTDTKDKILIVDDIPKNIQILATILNDSGYEIEFAENGKEATEIALEESFDLILMDIMMPVMNGYEACEQLKQISNYSDVPIIFLTAKTDESSITEGFEVGAVDYITKPFNKNELLARVKTHLDLKKNKERLNKLNNTLEFKVRQRTKELEIANNHLLQLDDSKTQFLQIINHEIRTPLNGIIGGISLIKDKDLSDKYLPLINMLDQSAKRLESFSYKALDISQLTTIGFNTLRIKEINLEDLLINVLSTLNIQIKEKNLSVKYSINQDYCSVNLDSSFMQKCLLQLLENSIKFTPIGGEINIDASKEQNILTIEINDTGIGFKPDFDLRKLKPFDTQEHVDNNPGLGLYLANLIVETHGGLMQTNNLYPNGAYLKISIPQ